MTTKRVVVLGGGMAGLAAAWRLSEPEHQGQVEVTVYQRGWRLGGKTASSRGVNGRIEEHGLHVWLGYYDNAFRLLRDCYAVLDRDRTDPACPIRSWLDAFAPASEVGVEDRAADPSTRWLARFPENGLVPGDEHPPLSATDLSQRALALAISFARSLAPSGPVRAALSPSPARPPAASGATTLAELAWPVAAAGLTVALETLRLARSRDGDGPVGGARVSRTVLDAVAGLERTLRSAIAVDDPGRRTFQLLDLILAMVRGIAVDRLAVTGWSSIDHLDFRQWLVLHGAAPETLDCPIVRGLYDLVFAYEGGDPQRPRFAAGLGLYLSGKIFFDYKGSIFWKSRAGMGDVVIAPLYQALRQRGVRFELFHRLDHVHLAADGRSVSALSLGRQVDLRPGHCEYEPLVDVGGLPVFPSVPLGQQLDVATDAEPVGTESESHWCRRPDAAAVRLEAGRDFDAVVLATSVGMVGHVCGELIERRPEWRAMVDHLGTVATRAAQIWLRPDEGRLGSPIGATVSASSPPFETWASMSHQLEHEDWPDDDRPATAAAFCGVLSDERCPAVHDRGDDDRGEVVERAEALVAAELEGFLDRGANGLWPGAVDAGGFRWDLLAGAGEATGPARLGAQFCKANIDPSDRYVQALPGTDQYRLAADGSGCENLFLSGDWIDSGLNAGCVEAAVVAGLQAANAALGRPLAEGVIEFRPRPSTRAPR